ncbi:hypothetical protein GBAR_LOCUS9364 [Geodia barretti]|uniref:Uncharacterized protein n=1 Tax=Geodia barretti TaxID=519541 RepID=A0AA35RRI7_GEOBA|nr:hypothetical protein GBAR_LOCUS9364 [Geodia barretti]
MRWASPRVRPLSPRRRSRYLTTPGHSEESHSESQTVPSLSPTTAPTVQLPRHLKRLVRGNQARDLPTHYRALPNRHLRPLALDDRPLSESLSLWTRERGQSTYPRVKIPAEISITAIMSKLEQVKSYLQEAQALHQQMKERLSEPGMAVQVNKMGRLVEDLRRQESGYLSILVKLLDQQKGGPLANSSQERTAETDDSREVLSDGEVSGELADEVGGEKRDDSMSLKAELLKERMETQREEKEKQELRMLREQRDLLTKLVEQQKQIEALEVRQRRLLDGNTTGHPPATTKTQAPPSEAGVLRNGAGQEKRQARVTTENMDDETTESAVVRRLQELRERRARVEHLTSLLAQLQTDTENERESQVPTSSAVAAAGNTGQQPLGGAGSGELVAAGSQAMPAELLELHQKLRQAQEAREKLAELQQMISLLQEPDVEGSEVTQDPPLVSSSRQGLLTRESQFEQQQQQQHRGEEEEEDERWTD